VCECVSVCSCVPVFVCFRFLFRFLCLCLCVEKSGGVDKHRWCRETRVMLRNTGGFEKHGCC